MSGYAVEVKLIPCEYSFTQHLAPFQLDTFSKIYQASQSLLLRSHIIQKIIIKKTVGLTNIHVIS